MFTNSGSMQSEKRVSALPLGKVREMYDSAVDALQLIVTSNPVLVEDPSTLMKLAKDTKTRLSYFNEMSAMLADKLVNVGGTNEVQELRVQRWQLRRETNEFIKIINNSLHKLNFDEVSNVDTASVDFHSPSLVVPTSASAAGGAEVREVRFDFTPNSLLGSENPVGGKTMTTFRNLLSPQPRDEQSGGINQSAEDCPLGGSKVKPH